MDHKSMEVMPGMHPPFVLLEVAPDVQAQLAKGADYSQQRFEEYVTGLFGIYSRDGGLAVRRCRVTSRWQRFVWWLFKRTCLV